MDAEPTSMPGAARLNEITLPVAVIATVSPMATGAGGEGGGAGLLLS